MATDKTKFSVLMNKVMKSFEYIDQRLNIVETTVANIWKIVGEDPKLQVSSLSLKSNINSLNNIFKKNNVF